MWPLRKSVRLLPARAYNTAFVKIHGIGRMRGWLWIVAVMLAGCQRPPAPTLPVLDTETLHPQAPVPLLPEPLGELPYPAEQTAILSKLLTGKRLAYSPVGKTNDGQVSAADVAQRMEKLFGMRPALTMNADYVLEFAPSSERRFADGGVRTTYVLAFYDTGVLKPLVARRFTFDMKLPPVTGSEGDAAHAAARNRAVWSALIYGGLFDGLAEVLPR